MHEIGFMQGRLVPSINGRIQAFPWARWQDEFELGRTHGFASIEFVFESERFRDNPIFADAGVVEIRRLIERTGVAVSAVCADYFMDHPFFRVGDGERRASLNVLLRLLEHAKQVGAARVEIPCVDQASLRTEEDKRQLVAAIAEALPLAERLGIEVAFETDLPPEEFREFLERFRHPLIKANYDTGNSASLGYDPVQELTVLGSLVANIHIKDRVLHGTTVPLGTGNTDFHAVFATLAKISYRGPFILQTARDSDDVGAAVRYKQVVEGYLKQYMG
jgi:hexulose-6-phosphate isomerase